MFKLEIKDDLEAEALITEILTCLITGKMRKLRICVRYA